MLNERSKGAPEPRAARLSTMPASLTSRRSLERSCNAVRVRVREGKPLGGSRDGAGDTRFDRRLGEILAHAVDVFYERGYEGASMRDLSRATRMSLAGLYYYFGSKEKLLYLVQRHTFATILEHLRERLKAVSDPEERVRAFVANHLEYFLANLKAMKVLSHEGEVLRGEYDGEIAAMKKEYYRICRELIEDLRRERPDEFGSAVPSRVAVMLLFGMMNWIYTWHNPRTDPGGEELARQTADIFLHGLRSGRPQAGLLARQGRSQPRADRQA